MTVTMLLSALLVLTVAAAIFIGIAADRAHQRAERLQRQLDGARLRIDMLERERLNDIMEAIIRRRASPNPTRSARPRSAKADLAQQARDAGTLHALLQKPHSLGGSNAAFAKSLLHGPYGFYTRGFWTNKQWPYVQELIEAAVLCLTVSQLRAYKKQAQAGKAPFTPPSNPATLLTTPGSKVCGCGKPKSPQYATCWPCHQKKVKQHIVELC